MPNHQLIAKLSSPVLIAGILAFSIFGITGAQMNSKNVSASENLKTETVNSVDLKTQEDIAKLKKLLAEQKKKETLIHQTFQNLQLEINNYLSSKSGVYGYELYSLYNLDGKTIEISIGTNQNRVFKMASTFKVPLNLYLYQQIAAGKISLTDQLTFTENDYEGGTGKLQYKPLGTNYSVGELSSLSIRLSDNVAVNMLMHRLGKKNILDYMLSLGTSGASKVNETPYGTPHDLIIYMQALQQLVIDYPELGNRMLNDLENTVFNDRIPAGLPKGIIVAHKIGNLTGVVNDVGIIYAPNSPYLLSIMSEKVNSEEAVEIEAHLSKMIWDTFYGIQSDAPAAN